MVNLHTCACNTVYPVFNSSTFCFFKNLEFSKKRLKCLPHVGVLVTLLFSFYAKGTVPCFGNVSLFKMRIRITFRILLITLMRIRILPFTLIRIRILPFNLTNDHPPFHFDADPDPAFHFDAASDPAFHCDADPDLASQNYADPDPHHYFNGWHYGRVSGAGSGSLSYWKARSGSASK